MKRITALLFIALLVVCNSSWANQKSKLENQVENMAEAISVPLYGYDLNSVNSVLASMVKESKVIKAIRLVDSNSDSAIFEATKSDDGKLVKGTISDNYLESLRKITTPVIVDGEEIALLTLFYEIRIDSKIKLTTEEVEWVKNNPTVKVGNELDWPPFDFAKDGKPMGYSIDLVLLAASKVGLEVEFINGLTWVQLLESLNSGDIDLLPAIYVNEKRKQSIAFTEAYYSQPSVLVVESSNKKLLSLKDLIGKKVAAIKGFAITAVLEEKYPEIKLIKFDSVVDSLMAVSTGQADAFIDSIGTVSYITEENFIPNVKFIRDPSLLEVENPALHMGVLKEKKVLRDILQKGLNAIDDDERKLLTDRWIQLEVLNATKKTSNRPLVWLAVGIASIFLCLLLAMAVFPKLSRSDRIDISLGTTKFRWITFSSLGVFISIVILVSWLVLEQNRTQILKGVEDNLQSTLHTTWERMHLWVDAKKTFLRQLSRDPELVETVEGLLKKNTSANDARDNFNSSGIRSFFEDKREEFGDFRYMVIDLNHTTIADHEGDHVGLTSNISRLSPDKLKALGEGDTIFIPAGSLAERIDTKNGNVADELDGMYFATPMRGSNGAIIAIFVQQLDPAAGFSQVLQFSRVGESGESYAFDKLGRLISKSRFEDHLRDIGLIKKGASGILSVEIRNPGGNLVDGFTSDVPRHDQPLTLMAENAINIKRKGGLSTKGLRIGDIRGNVEGYRDYRGVPVAGAWVWDAELGFGMTSEIDVDEALLPYITTRNTLVGILGFTLSLLVGITLFVFLVGEKTNRALKKAKEELEDKVRQRTVEIEAQRSMLELTIESLTHPFYVINVSDYSLELANSAAIKSGDANVTTCHALTHHSDTPCNSLEDPCPLEEVKRTKKPVVVEHIHFDEEGNEFYAEVHGYPIFDENGEVEKMIEYSLDITQRKKAEEELSKLSLAVEQSPISVVITNPQGVIEYVNPGFSEVTGYSLQEAVGKKPNILKSGNHPDAMYQKLWKKINGGMTWTGIFQNKKKDGTLYWENATISPIKDGKGNTTHFVGVKEDITQRVESEAKLKEAYNIIRQQKERMEQELNVGHEIQMSMLPLIFPAYPERDEFSINAKLQPAREVGGDFYDFYFVDDDHLCFSIGDVSDKGVPSALFMAVTTTLIKSRAADDFSTASIITHVNDELSLDNKASMFVTIVTGILNIKTGDLVYTNAGHNPPYIHRANGKLERLEERHGLVAGAMEGITYQEKKLKLESGDTLILYTDGVTEAENPEGELFGEEMLKELVENKRWKNTEEIVEGLYRAAKEFEDGLEQGDDITTMAIKFIGTVSGQEDAKFSVTLMNDLDEIPRIADEFDVFAEERGLPVTEVQRINIVLDEILNNVISYAYKDKKKHEILVEITYSGARLTVTITDDGVPFNPLSLQAPDTSASIDERDIGGLGIHMVKNMVDEISYHRKIDRNILKFEKKLN